MYTSWPKFLNQKERTLVTLSCGHIYRLVPQDDSKADSPLSLFKDAELIAEIYVDNGQVVDFAVSRDLVAVATKNPAGLYICRTLPGSNVIYTKFPVEPVDKQSVTSITIGNYGSNIIVLWHGDMIGPVYIGMISGRDAFRFDYKPLTYYDEWGRQRMFVKQEYEKVLAIPHMPGQFGTIATVSPMGIKFYALKPFYTMNKFTDHLMNAPLVYNTGWTDPTVQGFPTRVQFDCWDMMVQINDNHLTMKYDPTGIAKSTTKDWIKMTVNGKVLGPSDLLYMNPMGQDQKLNIQALEDLDSLTLHADLPVSFRLSHQLPDEALSNLGLGYLPKGSGVDILMRPMQCLTPWQLARFVEKFNVKIRAEVWS